MTHPIPPDARAEILAQCGRKNGLSDDLLSELLGGEVPQARAHDPDRMRWPADWYAPADANTLRGQARACVELWQAVFLQALRQEAQNAMMYARPGCSAEFILVNGWLASADGAEVMTLAGFDPQDCVSRLKTRIRKDGVAKWAEGIRAKAEADGDCDEG